VAAYIRYEGIIFERITKMSTQVNGFFINSVAPSATVAGCVQIYENIWPENTQNTIDSIEKCCSDPESDIYWEKASTIGQSVFQNHRVNKVCAITKFSQITNNSIVANIHNMFYNVILSTLPEYQKKYSIDDTLYEEGFSMLKYSYGEHYKSHYDGSTKDGRCISAICYLNSDFEGGELEFVNFKIKIKPQPGMLILFPSNYAYQHIAHPVTSGTKYAMVTWIKDRIV
jgi:hypothetical protein